MKYIISESRIESLVMNFLDEQFKGMKKHVNNLGDTTYTWWGIGNYGMLDITMEGDILGIGVNSEIYQGLRGTFNLSAGLAEEFLITWAENNLGIFPKEVYVF